MIKLFQFEPAFGLANASPFCMKLETYLRMGEQPCSLDASACAAGITPELTGA